MDKEQGIIGSVTESETCFYVNIKGSWSFGLDKKYGAIPKAGDQVTLHTVNFSTVRGVDLNGVNVFYKTDGQLAQEHKE